jgi:hypothetical protein
MELQEELKGYCEEKIPLKILVVLDNVPSHPPIFSDLSENIKVLFFLPI